MKVIRFLEKGDGDVDAPVLHLGSALGIDYTLCGITLDGDTQTAGEYEVLDAPAVTCEACLATIEHCRKATVSMRRSKKFDKGISI